MSNKMSNLGNQAVKELQIPSAMQELDVAIGNAMETRNAVEIRLSSVLHPEQAENEKTKPPELEPSVILVNSLNKFAERIREITRANESLLRRLEL